MHETIPQELLARLHTTTLGEERIRKNLALSDEEDVVQWCQMAIESQDAISWRQGKNWYIDTPAPPSSPLISSNADSSSIAKAAALVEPAQTAKTKVVCTPSSRQ